MYSNRSRSSTSVRVDLLAESLLLATARELKTTVSQSPLGYRKFSKFMIKSFHDKNHETKQYICANVIHINITIKQNKNKQKHNKKQIYIYITVFCSWQAGQFCAAAPTTAMLITPTRAMAIVSPFTQCDPVGSARGNGNCSALAAEVAYAYISCITVLL